MSLTLKQLLDNVLLESGMGTEVAYATSSRDSVARLIPLANASVRMIVTAHDWQALRSTYTFSLTTETEYDLPDDYRSIVADSTFTDSNLSGVDMRPTPTTWRYLQVNNTGSGVQYRMRVMGGKIHVFAPQSGDTVSFEYISSHPVMDADGVTTQKIFDADTDTWRLDDDLLQMNILWRYKKLLGLQDWQIDLQEYGRYLNICRGNDAPAKTIIGNEESYDEPYTPLWVNS